MHSQSLSGTMLLLVHLLLFSICVISSAVPIDVSNQPYTNVNTEEVTDYSLQHINKASEPISRTESTHPAEHTNTESTSIKTHHAQQEALASDIKNFVPDTKTGKGNQEDRIASMQNRDHGSEIYARAEHPEDPVGNELKEYGANSDAASPFKKVQSNKVDLPEQINRKVKAALQNADKAKRLSIFSVLHPALAAALTSEKTPEHSNIPRAPLNDVDYTTGPLKGTESHDRDALQYANTVPSRQAILAQIQEAVPRARETRGVKHVARGFGRKERRVAEEGELTNRHSQGDETVDNTAGSSDTERHIHGQYLQQERAVSHPKARDQVDSVNAEERTERDLNILKPEMNAQSDRESSGRISENSENSNRPPKGSFTLTPHSNASLNITVVEERSGMDRIMKTTARYWHGFVSRVKRVVEALKTPKSSPSQTPDNKLKDDFTEDDVQDMVNEIVHDLQRRNEEDIFSDKNSKHGNGWSTGDTKEHSSGGRKKGSLLMLRTKTLVSPDAVADAVTSAAKRMLSERGDSVSRETSSRFLREVQDKMEELLQPME